MAEDTPTGGGTPLERDAEDKIDTVRSIFSSDPPPPPPPPAPPAMPPGTPLADNQLAQTEAKEGCAKAIGARTVIAAIAILVGVVFVVGAVTFGDDDDKCKSRQRRDGFQLIACTPPTSTTDSSSASEEASSANADGTDPVTGLPIPNPNVVTANPNDSRALGGPASDAAFATPASAPAGSKLFKGSSGDQVGFIAQDGAFRYVSLEHPGVGVGETARPGLEIVWSDGDGVITEFGVRTTGGSNSGRYGLNPYANGGTYLHGCALEVGQTACKFSTPSKTPVHDGDRVVIQIGEAGHLDERGDFTFEWWFIFQPS